MPPVAPPVSQARRVVLTALSAFALAALARALGFGAGLLLGATAASAIALGAAVILRGPGAAAAGAGIALAGFLFGLGPALAVFDGAAHGAAALLGSTLMRWLARARAGRSRTSDWLILLAGIALFTATVALAYGAVALAQGSRPADLALGALVFQPLGLFTAGAALASLREWRQVRCDPGPALRMLVLATGLIALLWLLLTLPIESVSASGVTLLLSLPFCVWVAMQRRSLDGAALSFLAAHVVLAILLADSGSVASVDYMTTVVYLDVLVAVCQLVHAVNLDRLSAVGELEERRDDLERRVAQRTAKLRHVTERALAADAAKTRFLATVSHEVRTPLSGIIGMASLLLVDDLDPPTRRKVEMIRTSGHHLLDIINRLLEFGRRDQPLGEADLADFDLGELAREVVAEARFLPYAAGIEIRTEFDPSLDFGRRGYRHGLRQVLTNLVGNAAKFTEAGTVTLRLLAGPGSTVRIEVEDTGPGVPDELQVRIFEPFEQGDGPGARRYGGTGLGLAISADVVRRVGGRIGVKTAPGGGALFWLELSLPLAGAQAAAPARA